MKLTRTIKRLSATGAAALLTVTGVLTLATGSALAANIQEEAAIYAGNVTQGVNFTHAGVTAKDNDVVAFEVYYHNLESPDSGLDADNVCISASIPDTVTTVHTVGATVSGDNFSTVTDSTTVTTSDATQLQFLPSDGVTWKHDIGTNANPDWVTTTISNSVVNGNSCVVVDQNEQPSNNFAGTIVFEATVVPQPPTPPAYTCNDLELTAESDRTVKVSKFDTTATNGAAFSTAAITWGDGGTLNSSSPVGQSHQYSKDGTYTVTATAHFTINGQGDVTAGGPQCQKQVTFSSTTPPKVTPPPTTPPTPATPAAPTALVNTGPGSVAGLFAAATAAGTVIYRRMLTRRLSRQ